MSRDGRVDLDFADGTYSFRLGLGQWPELQDKCNAGPYAILNRLHSGAWRVEDINEVVRLGLIGGGLAPAKALTMVRSYVYDRPPMENLMLAIGVLSASLMGVPEEPLGEDDAASLAVGNSTTFQTEKSDLLPSTEPEPPAGSLRKKSMQ